VALLALMAAVFAAGAGRAPLGDGLLPHPAESQTKELAERLLEGELVVGRIPDDVQRELPVPPGVRVLGGLDWSRGAGTKGSGARVVFDAPGAASDLVAFYVRELPPRGWTVNFVRSGPQAGTPPTSAGAVFCRDAGRWLHVEASTRPNGLNDVRLSLENAYPPRPCTPQPTPLPGGIYVPTPTPTVRP
jgi:hypothetical protein